MVVTGKNIANNKFFVFIFKYFIIYLLAKIRIIPEIAKQFTEILWIAKKEFNFC